MKKYFYSFFAAVALMLAATSCSQEEMVGGETSGNEVEVSFNLELEGQTASRAIGDGLTVDQLVFAVFDMQGNEITGLRQEDVPVSNLGAVVTTHLVKGQTYQFVFWAQKEGTGHYNTTDMAKIKVNTANVLNNDETRDAFYAHEGATKVTGPFSKTITLKRPFAQLNLGTSAQDLSWAADAGVTIGQTSVKVTGAVYSQLNTLDGTLADAVVAEMALNAVPDKDSERLIIDDPEEKFDNDEYYYLSTSYLLAPAAKTLSEEIIFTLVDEAGNQINELFVYNAPLERNWRTNIVGDILTGEGTFNIVIDPIFEADRNYWMEGSILDVLQSANNPVEGTDYVDNGSYLDVYSAAGLLKWISRLNAGEKTLGLQLKDDIVLPPYVIDVDAAAEGDLKYTSTPITTDQDGKPSGSNWISMGTDGNTNIFEGSIDGNGHTIKGLRINGGDGSAINIIGFIGYMQKGAEMKNINFDDAIVYNGHSQDDGRAATGIAVGRAQDGTLVENVNITNSTVMGKNSVGGVVGYNYRRKGGNNNYTEEFAYIKNCTTDQNTIVKGNGYVGGICGNNYGAVILNCVNNADVTGADHVGGVVGESRSYSPLASGFLIASGSTENATITSTKHAGGVLGRIFADKTHQEGGAQSYVVACYSRSKVNAAKAGTLVGNLYSSDHTGKFFSSWAEKKDGSMNEYGGVQSGSPFMDKTATQHFSNASEITAEFYDDMKQAIADFNTLMPEGINCPYTWSWTNGSWPELN